MGTVQTDTVNKRGRPAIPRYKINQEIVGTTILSYIGFKHTGQGRQHCYLLECSCGSHFEQNQKQIVNAWREKRTLSCKKCTDKSRGQNELNWTQSELDFLIKYYPDQNYNFLKNKIYRSTNAIYKKANSLGLTKNVKNKTHKKSSRIKQSSKMEKDKLEVSKMGWRLCSL